MPQRDDEVHSRIGALHMSVIKAAFRCDLTRVATFQFTPGTNHVSFGDMWPPNPTQFKVHHTTSHDPGSADQAEFLTRVEEFYAERVSAEDRSIGFVIAAASIDETTCPVRACARGCPLPAAP